MEKFASEIKIGTKEPDVIQGIKDACKTFTDKKEKQVGIG